MKEYQRIELWIQVFEQDIVTTSGYVLGEDNANEVPDGWFE